MDHKHSAMVVHNCICISSELASISDTVAGENKFVHVHAVTLRVKYTLHLTYL